MPKHIHIATVGYREDNIYKVFNHLQDVDSLYLLYTVDDVSVEKDRYLNIAKNIKAELTKFCSDIHLMPVGLEDFMGIVQTIYAIAKENGTEPKYTINITGGTKLMSAAAYYSAYYIRAETYYYQYIEDIDKNPIPDRIKVIKIDSPKAVNIGKYTKLQKDILNMINQNENGTLDKRKFLYPNILCNEDMARELNTSKQNISNNLKTLKDRGLIEIEPTGRNNTVKLTPHGVMIARYVYTEDVKILNEW